VRKGSVEAAERGSRQCEYRDVRPEGQILHKTFPAFRNGAARHVPGLPGQDGEDGRL